MILVDWSQMGQHYNVTTIDHCHKSAPIVICLLLIYILATFKVISGLVPTCDSAWKLYSAAQL